jgi:plasmid stabilization system protein ParE
MARSVVYAPEAAEDLLHLYRYIAEQSGLERARGYVARTEGHCTSLAEFPHGGDGGTISGQRIRISSVLAPLLGPQDGLTLGLTNYLEPVDEVCRPGKLRGR